jgi:hypothetical protein
MGAWPGWHRHPLSGDQLGVGRQLEFDHWGHRHPRSGDRIALSGALAEIAPKG